ncbi:MAG: carbamoyltransferase HypF [Verrucomicrobia bacterium]|nr:carbamoyltransferase HypF [Verrucomicrobiota bacterium]
MRLRVVIRGAVQGVGFRPFVFRLASELGLRGWVNNSSQGVLIEVEGSREALEEFLIRVQAEAPVRAFIQSLEPTWLDALGFEGFEIRKSDVVGEKSALILPDIATCPECLGEVLDPADRRHLYPFTNCTNCGPRFSIIEALPYDRPNTSMKGFAMCDECRAEYENPASRRFHAQPNACPRCGPQLELWGCDPASGNAGGPRFHTRDHPAAGRGAIGHEALLAAAKAIADGAIVAVKGLGGFHLLCRASDESVVGRLRERKHREEKPFAVMFPSVESVREHCEVVPLEERLLSSPEAPIVLLRRRSEQPGARCLPSSKGCIAPAVAPGNPWLGALLPYTPLHHLLLREIGFPVVATSGNLSDEPICTDEAEAVTRLAGIADCLLVHNRPIVRHVDDSIVRVTAGREMVLRRARGYAPLPVGLGSEIRNPQSAITLGVGAHLKNAVALSVGAQVFVSQHIGDLETEAAMEAFQRVVDDLQRLYGVSATQLVSDAHPEYLSTKFARDRVASASLPAGLQDIPASSGLPVNSQAGSLRHVEVQHHVAHVLSCMAENERDAPVLGVSWDGTGYGLDGTVWGGEFIRIDRRGPGMDWRRVGHLRPFRLPGGDKAVREPRRCALGLLHELQGGRLEGLAGTPVGSAFPPEELGALARMLERGLNSPLTSSMGRLFDAVASLTGLRQFVRHEGQAAMALEFAADGVDTEGAYALPIGNCQSPGTKGQWRTEQPGASSTSSRPAPHASAVLDWKPLIEAVLADLRMNVPVGLISARFHNALSEAIVAMARREGLESVVLSGGCFQNRRLLERTITRLRQEGFRPYWHQRVPANDGGIALGQVASVLWNLKTSLPGSSLGCDR